ncbi:MAG: asparagine synthetase A [Candidatus Saccharibacteria bacterium]|nr:asparagine synthetase A [Candidatus Saccharibacteria bacterium]
MNTPWSYKNSWKNAIDNDWCRLIFKLQALIQIETVKFYEARGIVPLLLPVTTGSISSPMGLGSDSLPVQIELDGRKTYLADSMQFLLEYGCRFFEKGCYYIMPTFRGEPVNARHLKQFFHSEAEIPGSLDDVIQLTDSYIKHLSAAILEKYGVKIREIVGNTEHIENLIKNQIPRFAFDEVEKILEEKCSDDLRECIEYNDGFRSITSAGEKAIMEIVGSPLWITHYDKNAVPFYQKTDEKYNGQAKNADLLLGIGETVGCGERNSTAKEVIESLRERQISPGEYQWYIELREKYPLQTSGFGLGIERFLLFILGHDDIRDAQVIRRFNDGKDIL